MTRRERNRWIYTGLLILFIIGFWLFENFYTPDTYSSPEGNGSNETTAYLLPKSTTGAVVAHDHFTLSYHERYEQAEWVAYTLKREHLTYDDRERPYFIEDPKVRTKSADWRNYRGSGYDRGHLCPAGDRRFSEYAYNQTFYTSNISPQRKDFNAGIWNRLEMQVRSWCKQYGTLQVVVGGVLESGLQEIGDEDVAVPERYYKIISRGESDELEVIAFMMPHYESQRPLQDFVVTIDQVEEATGIDFFSELPDSIENKIEAQAKTRSWRFR